MQCDVIAVNMEITSLASHFCPTHFHAFHCNLSEKFPSFYQLLCRRNSKVFELELQEMLKSGGLQKHYLGFSSVIVRGTIAAILWSCFNLCYQSLFQQICSVLCRLLTLRKIEECVNFTFIHTHIMVQVIFIFNQCLKSLKYAFVSIKSFKKILCTFGNALSLRR